MICEDMSIYKNVHEKLEEFTNNNIIYGFVKIIINCSLSEKKMESLRLIGK
jgi:hypothetical protein